MKNETKSTDTRNEGKAMSNAIKQLASKGISTIGDLDAYRNGHPKTDRQGSGYVASRYSTIKAIVGENAAISIMHELATQQCC